MVPARERSNFVETNRDRGGHGLGDALETLSAIGPVGRSHSRGSRNSFGRSIYDRAQLVGCQPIVCSAAAMPGPIVDFGDEFLRQIGKHRVTYALTGRRLADLVLNKAINLALIHGARSKGAQVKVKATSAGGNGCQSATRIELRRIPPRGASLSPPTTNGRCRNWRLTCPKTIKNFRATPSNGAPFAPESLALFVTTLREPPSAQRGALSTSSPVAKQTAIGYGDYPPPERSAAAENAPPAAARSAARLVRRRNH